MKFLVPNYRCLQNPRLGAIAPRSPFSLSSTEFVELPLNKIPEYTTDVQSLYYTHNHCSHNESSDLVPGQFIMDLLGNKSGFNTGFSPRISVFPLSVSFYKCYLLNFNLSDTDAIQSQLMTALQNTPPTHMSNFIRHLSPQLCFIILYLNAPDYRAC